MGSLLSPIIVDIVQDLEEASLNKINFKIYYSTFYYRHVDDIIMAASSDNENYENLSHIQQLS